MSESKPRASDLVLGGQTPTPKYGVVLGGLAGIEQRLASESLLLRLQGLKDIIHYGDREQTFTIGLEAINSARHLFPKLRALFVGDSMLDLDPENTKSKLEILEIRSLLTSFPNLEILEVAGHFHYHQLDCSQLKHQNLKTIIIKTEKISVNNIDQICSISLPNLEYLELWLGKGGNTNEIKKAMQPILSGVSAPNLQYLGLCGYHDTNSLVAEILSSSMIDRLAVVALKMAGITMQGVSTLTNSPNLENLKLLHISGSVISPEALHLLQNMRCKLDLRKNQYTPKFDR